MSRYLISVGGRVVAAAIQLFTFGLLARYFGVADFGIFVATFAAITILMLVADLGMGPRALRGGSDPFTRPNVATAALLRLAVGLLLIAIAVPWSVLVSPVPVPVIAAAILAFGDSAGDFALAILQGEKRSKAAMSTLVIRRAVTLSPLIFVTAGPVALFSGVAGGATGVLVLVLIVAQRRSRPRNVLALARENARIVLSSGASSIAVADVMLVSFFASPFSAGLYGAATRLLNPINIAVSTMVQVLVPDLTSSNSNEERLRQFRRVRLIVLLFSALLALFSPFAPHLVTLIFGSSFQDSAAVAVVVFLCAGLSALAQVHFAWYYAMGLPGSVWRGMWIATLGGLLSIALGSLGWGIAGAAGGLLLLYLLSTVAIVLPWYLKGGHGGLGLG